MDAPSHVNCFCLRPKAKDLGITRVIAVVVLAVVLFLIEPFPASFFFIFFSSTQFLNTVYSK